MLIMNNINKEFIMYVFNTCKSKQEFINAIGINTLHRSGTTIDDEILNYLTFANSTSNFSKNDITAKAFKQRYKERLYKEYLNNPNLCKNCGKIIPFERKDNKCCCTSCSRSIANIERGARTYETKQKISVSLQNRNKTPQYYVCPICGKEFERKRLANGRLSKSKTCSDECHYKLKHINGKNSYGLIKAEGRFQGWKTRNITSYPEKFWITVLNNNNIEFERELFFDNKYFLDFVIRKNNVVIDLEIDGKQHNYPDRKQHDIERDTYLTSKNVIVYRIPWNSINTNKGKAIMQEKIKSFIDFYNTL